MSNSVNPYINVPNINFTSESLGPPTLEELETNLPEINWNIEEEKEAIENEMSNLPYQVPDHDLARVASIKLIRSFIKEVCYKFFPRDKKSELIQYLGSFIIDRRVISVNIKLEIICNDVPVIYPIGEDPLITLIKKVRSSISRADDLKYSNGWKKSFIDQLDQIMGGEKTSKIEHTINDCLVI